MKRAALSYDAMLADVYWIRALQHFGGERLKAAGERRFDLLYPLLDLTTTLDPLFTVGVPVRRHLSRRAAPGRRRPARAGHRTAEKGHRRQSGRSGTTTTTSGSSITGISTTTSSAAEWFKRGGEVPGAPWWLETYAAVMLTRGGDRQASRAMWTQIGQSQESEWLRQTSQVRLAQLDALDQIDTLRRVLMSFRRRMGYRGAVVAASDRRRSLARRAAGSCTGSLTGSTPQTGEIGVARESPLWPLPTEPAAAPELKNAAPPVPPR